MLRQTWTSNPECTNGLNTAFASVMYFLGFSWLPPVISFMAYRFTGGSAAIALLCCSEWLSFDYCFALLVIIFPDVLGFTVLAFLLGREATFGTPKKIISTFCALILSPIWRSSVFTERVSRHFSQNDLIEARVLRWTKMSLNSQPKKLLSHFGLNLLTFRFFLSLLLESSHSTDEKRHNRVKTSFYSMSLCDKKQQKGQELFLLLFHVKNMKVIKEGPGVHMKSFCVGRTMPVVFLDDGDDSFNYEDDVILRENVKYWVCNFRCALSICHWTVFGQLPKRREYAFVLFHHFANSNVVYIGRFRAYSQDIWERRVFPNVCYMYIDKLCATFFSPRSCVA